MSNTVPHGNLTEHFRSTRHRCWSLAPKVSCYPWGGVRRNQNFEKVTYAFGLFDFEIFFRRSFFSFSFLFAAVIDLLLGFLAVKKTSKKESSRQAIFTMEQPGVRVLAGNFALSC